MKTWNFRKKYFFGINTNKITGYRFPSKTYSEPGIVHMPIIPAFGRQKQADL